MRAAAGRPLSPEGGQSAAGLAADQPPREPAGRVALTAAVWTAEM